MVYIFFRDFLHRKSLHPLIDVLALVIGYSALLFIAFAFRSRLEFMMLTYFVVTTAIGLTLCSARIYTRILSALLFVIIHLLAAGISLLITAALNSVDYLSIITKEPLAFQANIFRCLLLLSAVWTIYRMRFRVHLNIWPLYPYALEVIPVISILAVCALLHAAIFDGTAVIYAVTGLLILLYLNLYLFLIFIGILYQMERNYVQKIIDQRAKMQSLHYMDLMEKSRQIHELWHDLKNHIYCIFALSKRGDYNELDKYVQSLVNMASPIKDIDTGNPVIDSIITGKKSKASKLNIAINTILNIPPGLKIEPAGICAILGNALDNAIEAVDKLESPEDKSVELEMEMLGDSLFISIANPYNELPQKMGKFFKSSKIAPGVHGIGLHSIERAVRKYDGIMLIKTDDGRFILEIVLNLQSNN